MVKNKDIVVSISGQEISDETRLVQEVERSRKAMTLVREKLGMDGMLKLFEKELEESDRYFKSLMDGFDGKTWNPAHVDMYVKNGGTGQEYLNWWMKTLALDGGRTLIHNNPDHWGCICDGQTGEQDAIETICCTGGPFRFTMKIYEPEGPVEQPLYPTFVYGTIYSHDGVVLQKVLHQFEDLEDGFHVKLGIYFPHTYPDELVRNEELHLMVEWHTWLDWYMDSRKEG